MKLETAVSGVLLVVLVVFIVFSFQLVLSGALDPSTIQKVLP